MQSPKITRPRVPRVLVRARLFRVIDRAREMPLVWVMAPPGAGKTTLISHYLEQRRRRHVWYQVDSGDHDIAGLFNHLGLAADAMRRRTRRPALPRYAPEYLPDIDAFFRTFFRALFERLPDGTTLIFDDYQEIADDATFHRALSTALEQMPHGHQIVVISRNVAPPAFARLWAGRQVALIDWDALKLTREETRRLAALQRTRAGGATPDNLHDQCEGWITGFILLLEQSRTAAGAQRSRLPAAVAEYFEEQVFARASPELRTLWLRTAYLPRFTASTAARVSGMRNAPALVDTLARRQFFVQQHGSGNATLQYHALWRDFLLHRTEAAWSSGERRRLVRRSAAALREQGDHEAALELFCGAKDWHAAEQVLLDSAEAFLAQGRWHTLHGWISRVLHAAVATRPELLYWDAVCQTQIDPGTSLPAIERAYEAFAAAGSEAGQASCASLAIAANFAEWGNFAQRGRWFRILEQLLARDPTFPDLVSEARAWSALLFVFSLEIGDFPFAEVCAQRVLHLCRARLPDTERLAAASHLLFYLNQVASAEDVREALQEFAPLAAADGLTPLQKTTWHLSESTYFYHVGDTSSALRVNRQARALLPADQWRGPLVMLDLLDAWALLAGTQIDRARRQLDGVAPRIDRTRPGDVAHYHHLRAWLALLEAQPHAAVEHAEQATHITRRLASRTPLVNSLCVYALALADCARLDEAAAAVDEAVRASAVARGIVRFTALAFKTELLRRRRGTGDDLAAALAETFAAARRSGFVNCVVWIPAMMSRLCAEALSRGIETDHVERLIRARALAPPAADTEVWPWPVRVYTLGRFDIAIDGRRLEFGGKAQKRPLDLLKMLVAFGGRRVAVERLTAELWPSAEGDAAYRAFKVSLHRLRRLFGSDEVVHVENGEVTLDARRVFVDSWTFERWFTDANARNSGVALADAAVTRVLAQYQGAFLGADARPWALAARERLRSKFVRGLILAAEAQQRRGDWERAAASYERGVDVEPAAEEIYVRLMRCYQRLGRYAEALAVYRRCETMLTSLLQSHPTRATRALYEELRRLV